MLARIAFTLVYIVLSSSLPSTESFCHGSRTSYRASAVGELVRDDFALLGHVFATFQVQNFSRCFVKCKDDCRCRSFNLPITREGECELNDADNSTALMKPRRGWRYHHLEKTELRKGSDTCYEAYENGCCATDPCRNATNCTDIPDHGKPTFNCTCTEGYTGPTCARKIHSCFDYLWNDRSSASEFYDVWDKAGGKSVVFCDMQPEKLEAWTLVSSYKRSEAVNHASNPFFVSYVPGEADVTNSYRLSLDKMKTVREGMGQERELEWKATCDYSFTDGHVKNTETVRSRFRTLDIMKFTTNRNSIVGHYPFNNKTKKKDKSGFGNHASFYGTVYEDGPLGDEAGSVRMAGLPSSYIEFNDHSGKLDTRYSITIMFQLYPHSSSSMPLLTWGTSGVDLFFLGGSDIYFRTRNRGNTAGHIIQVAGLGYNMWNYLAVTYDHKKKLQAVYLNGTLLRRDNVSVSMASLRTQSSLPLKMGVKPGDSRYLNGRMSCVRMFSLALTEDEVKREMKDWKCPQEPEPICHRVDYINVRGNECYNCDVWATQTNTEAFTINAHRGDQSDGCNFKSGSTVANENIFGVYTAKDESTHACATRVDSTTQYWFGGRLQDWKR